MNYKVVITLIRQKGNQDGNAKGTISKTHGTRALAERHHACNMGLLGSQSLPPYLFLEIYQQQLRVEHVCVTMRLDELVSGDASATS